MTIERKHKRHLSLLVIYKNYIYYDSKKDIIEENYQNALKYIDYEQNIVNKITEVFKLNKLI